MHDKLKKIKCGHCYFAKKQEENIRDLIRLQQMVKECAELFASEVNSGRLKHSKECLNE